MNHDQLQEWTRGLAKALTDLREECWDAKGKGPFAYVVRVGERASPRLAVRLVQGVDRLAIRACYPTDRENNEYPGDGPTATVTVAADRPLDEVARDVNRRLVRPYVEAFPKALALAEAANRQADGTLALARQLAEAAGLQQSGHFPLQVNGQAECGAYVRGRVNTSGTVDVSISSMSAEVARAVLSCLTNRKGSDAVANGEGAAAGGGEGD